MSAHTPGPWWLMNENRARRVIRGGRVGQERTVCIIESWTTEPDAALIATAPDLLAMLEKLSAEYETDSHFTHSLHPDDMVQIRAVISKANGDAS